LKPPETPQWWLKPKEVLMFNPHPGASPNKASAMSQGVAAMGTVGGIAGAVLFTPSLYSLTKPSILQFLSEAWSPNLAPLLTWVMGACECLLIFVTVKVAIVSLATWALMSLTRKFI
jgi:hypothetical protein